MEESTHESEAAVTEEPGVASRMLNVLFSPGEVFTSVNRSVGHADWLIPLIVTAIVSVIAMQVAKPVVASDARAQIEAMMGDNTDIPDAEREKALARAENVTGITTTVMAAVMTFVMAVILALIYMALANFLLGGEATFKKCLAVTGYTSLVGIPAAIVSVPVALSMGTLQVQFGPGLLLPESMAGSFFYNLMAVTNLFQIWQLALVSIGIGIVAGTATGRTAIGVFILYAVYLVGASALKTAFLG